MSANVRFQPNPNATNELRDQLSDAVGTAAKTMADRLRANLAWDAGESGVRTGRHYANLPHRSSAQGQYPQEQSGSLRRSVDDRNEAAEGMMFTRGVGFYGESMKKLEELELKQWAGRRKPLTMLAENPETREEMAEAIRNNDSV